MNDPFKPKPQEIPRVTEVDRSEAWRELVRQHIAQMDLVERRSAEYEGQVFRLEMENINLRTVVWGFLGIMVLMAGALAGLASKLDEARAPVAKVTIGHAADAGVRMEGVTQHPSMLWACESMPHGGMSCGHAIEPVRNP